MKKFTFAFAFALSLAAFLLGSVKTAVAGNTARVSFSYSYSPKSSGSTDIRYGTKYIFFRKKGGGKYGDDVAACVVSRNGSVQASNKDSAAPNAVLGKPVWRGCSFATYSKYTVACCVS